MTDFLSECCGAEPDHIFTVFENAGICSNCGEHCRFIEEAEDD
tara:strand:+ start:2046 stop:2174 length:129 start_codon:yes stop_codon:yes gene_type:complete